MKDFIIDVSTGGTGVTIKGFASILVIANDVTIPYTKVTELSDLKIGKETETYNLIRTLLSQDFTADIAIIGKKTEVLEEQVKLLDEVINKDFFFITTTDNTEKTIKAFSKEIETMGKMYFVTVNDVAIKNTLLADNTVIVVHDDKDMRVAEGLSVIMTDKVGGKTAMFKTVKGITTPEYDVTTAQKLQENSLNIYKERLGKRYVADGVTTSGEYVDVILARHWLIARLEEDMLDYFTSTDNVDFTDEGISEMVTVVEKRMSLAVSQGIFEDDYKINYKQKSEIPATERKGRRYDYLSVEGNLKGAIHGARVRIFMVV